MLMGTVHTDKYVFIQNVGRIRKGTGCVATMCSGEVESFTVDEIVDINGYYITFVTTEGKYLPLSNIKYLRISK